MHAAVHHASPHRLLLWVVVVVGFVAGLATGASHRSRVTMLDLVAPEISAPSAVHAPTLPESSVRICR